MESWFLIYGVKSYQFIQRLKIIMVSSEREKKMEILINNFEIE